MQDISGGAVDYLSGFPAVTAAVGAFAHNDPVNPDVPYIFDSDLLVTLEGTSKAAIVCEGMGGWGTPEVYSTARFHRLSVRVYVDPLRDSDRNIVESSGLTRVRGMAAWAAVDHVPAPHQR